MAGAKHRDLRLHLAHGLEQQHGHAAAALAQAGAEAEALQVGVLLATHLGEPAGGRAEGWKRFTRTLDGLAFSAEEEAAVEKGAIDAFVRFTVLLEQAYASAPELA